MTHLPSLAQLDRATRTRIWLCVGPTAMRHAIAYPSPVGHSQHVAAVLLTEPNPDARRA